MELLEHALRAFAADPIIAIGNVIALSYIVPLVLFVVQYETRSPWWTTDLGIALLAQKLAFIAVFILIDLGIFFHDWPGRGYVRIALYALIAVSLWLDQVNLTRYQRRYHHDRVVTPRPSWRTILRMQFHGSDTQEIPVQQPR